MKYLKEYKGFDNFTPEGVKLYCHDLLAELRDDHFKTSVEVSGKWLEPLSMKDKSYVHIDISKKISHMQEDFAFTWSDIKEYVDVITNYLSELGFKDMGFGSQILKTNAIRNPYDFSISEIKSSCDLWYVRDEPEETNEELKYQSYQSAAAKLSKLGHVKRSTELQKWSDEIKKREYDAKAKMYEEDAKQLGTFQMKITGNKQNIEGDFYVSFYFNTDTIDDQFDNWYDGGQLWLEFPFAVIPVNDETKAKMIEGVEPNYGKPNNGMYYFQSMYLNFSKAITLGSDSEEDKKSWVMKPRGSVSLEDYGEFYPVFSNRSSAVRFKKALIDVFEGKIVLRETEKDPGGVKGMLMDELCSERDRTFEEFLSFIDSLKKISINSLYKD
jgi:hypothetical protein